MTSTRAVVVPISETAKEALARPRNQPKTVAVSHLPLAWQGVIRTELPLQEGQVVVYDPVDVHIGKSVTFGRSRTSEVQLLAQDVDLLHFSLSADSEGSLWLTNHTRARDQFASLLVDGVSLTPGSVVQLVRTTSIALGAYRFRIYLHQGVHAPDTIQPVGNDEPAEGTQAASCIVGLPGSTDPVEVIDLTGSGGPAEVIDPVEVIDLTGSGGPAEVMDLTESVGPTDSMEPMDVVPTTVAIVDLSGSDDPNSEDGTSSDETLGSVDLGLSRGTKRSFDGDAGPGCLHDHGRGGSAVDTREPRPKRVRVAGRRASAGSEVHRWVTPLAYTAFACVSVYGAVNLFFL